MQLHCTLGCWQELRIDSVDGHAAFDLIQRTSNPSTNFHYGRPTGTMKASRNISPLAYMVAFHRGPPYTICKAAAIRVHIAHIAVWPRCEELHPDLLLVFLILILTASSIPKTKQHPELPLP